MQYINYYKSMVIISTLADTQDPKPATNTLPGFYKLTILIQECMEMQKSEIMAYIAHGKLFCNHKLVDMKNCLLISDMLASSYRDLLMAKHKKVELSVQQSLLVCSQYREALDEMAKMDNSIIIQHDYTADLEVVENFEKGIQSDFYEIKIAVEEFSQGMEVRRQLMNFWDTFVAEVENACGDLQIIMLECSKCFHGQVIENWPHHEVICDGKVLSLLKQVYCYLDCMALEVNREPNSTENLRAIIDQMSTE